VSATTIEYYATFADRVLAGVAGQLEQRNTPGVSFLSIHEIPAYLGLADIENFTGGVTTRWHIGVDGAAVKNAVDEVVDDFDLLGIARYDRSAALLTLSPLGSVAARSSIASALSLPGRDDLALEDVRLLDLLVQHVVAAQSPGAQYMTRNVGVHLSDLFRELYGEWDRGRDRARAYSLLRRLSGPNYVRSTADMNGDFTLYAHYPGFLVANPALAG
jgi:hypothetical protein